MGKARFWVAGSDTLLGAALTRRLQQADLAPALALAPDGQQQPDCTSAAQVADFLEEFRPEYIFLCAGQSGGIGLNRQRPADLMLDNLLVATTVIPLAHEYRIRKLLYLASSCSYPRDAAQPLRVETLGEGKTEPTSSFYATAKIAGMELCSAFRHQYGDDFRSAIPANAFGPGDDFSPQSGHVIAALMTRLHEAKIASLPEVTVWGSGRPRREFVYADDVADAALFVMLHETPPVINLGGGNDVSIAELAKLLAEVVGYQGHLVFDQSKPDGAPLKRLDATPLFAMGWRPRYTLRDALTETYSWFLQHVVTEDRRDVTAAVPVALPNPAS